MNLPKLVLMTDFGDRDGFVGVLKGVVHTHLKQPVPILDLAHGVEPQNCYHAAWVLSRSYGYFPPQSIFVSVVDPWRGSFAQTSLLVVWPERQQYFLAPDNGLLTPILKAGGETLQIYAIQNAPQLVPPVSKIFHGRDIYAPMAAHLANAIMAGQSAEFFSMLTPFERTKAVMLAWADPEKLGEGSLQGQLVHQDRFGNLITNIPNEWITVCRRYLVRLGQQKTMVMDSYNSYYDGGMSEDGIFIVPTGNSTLEICRFQASAAQFLGVSSGETITITALR